jgi:hypothetical protein
MEFPTEVTFNVNSLVLSIVVASILGYFLLRFILQDLFGIRRVIRNQEKMSKELAEISKTLSASLMYHRYQYFSMTTQIPLEDETLEND